MSQEPLSELLGPFVELARRSPKKRDTFMIHFSTKQEPYGTMLTALCPPFYLQPHMHPEAAEIFEPLLGRTTLVTFDETGEPIDYRTLSKQRKVHIVVAARTYHTILPSEEPAVIKTIYQGRYDPRTYKEEPDWAPQEEADEGDIQKYLERLRRKLKAIKHKH